MAPPCPPMKTRPAHGRRASGNRDNSRTGPGVEREVRADDASAGRRLDAVLAAALDGLSRTRVQALVKQGAVSDGDGRIVTSPAMKVAAGQRFTVDVPAPAPARPAPQAIPLEIAFEDDHLIVIDKPAGMVVHPGAGSPDGTLVNALLAHCGDAFRASAASRAPVSSTASTRTPPACWSPPSRTRRMPDWRPSSRTTARSGTTRRWPGASPGRSPARSTRRSAAIRRTARKWPYGATEGGLPERIMR